MWKVELFIIPMNEVYESHGDIMIDIENAVDEALFHIGNVEEADIGEWDDDHELNKITTPTVKYRKYFKKTEE
jgi:hypothetical protein